VLVEMLDAGYWMTEDGRRTKDELRISDLGSRIAEEISIVAQDFFQSKSSNKSSSLVVRKMIIVSVLGITT
jgi:hypothetical protein